jgi:hypothetical protein
MKTSTIIAWFSNNHGWLDYSAFNEWMVLRGFSVTQLERHNRTDGEVHFRYTHTATSQSFEFNGNLIVLVKWLFG